MKKYNIKVNGITYEVEVEEIKEDIERVQILVTEGHLSKIPQTPKEQVERASYFRRKNRISNTGDCN